MIPVLSTAYFPPVPWFVVIATSGNARIESHENYKKQSYRNRCEILSSNGKLALSIPLIKNHGTKTAIRDVCIDYSAPWQRIHLHAIRSAYGKTPYFIHYFDAVEEIISTGFETLWELNRKSQEWLCAELKLEIPASTSEYIKEYPGNDFRDAIHPKLSPLYTQPEYFQAFSPRFGFVPGLSALDLIFNLGPDAAQHVKETHSRTS